MNVPRRTVGVDRVVPYDLEAEQSVLGAILIENALLQTATKYLTERDFYRDAHSLIFVTMVSLAQRGSVIDFITLKAELTQADMLERVGGPAYIASLVDGVPKSMNIEHYAAVVSDLATCRDVLESAEHIKKVASQGDPAAIRAAIEEMNVLASAPNFFSRGGCRGPVFEDIANVESAPIEWLSPRRLARGELTILAGDPGVGKTWIALDMTARVTRGRAFPDGVEPPPTPSTAILMANEDRPTELRERLRMVRADLTRVKLLTGLRDARGDTREVYLSDIEGLEGAIVEANAALLVIDPLNDFIRGIDNHNDVQIRSVLRPLVKVARRRNVAILGTMHLNKDQRRGGLHRMMGSVGYGGVARIVLFAAKSAKERNRGLLYSEKNNLAEEAEVLEYTITSGRRPRWRSPEGPFDRDLLLNARATDAPALTAREFLEELLADSRETWPLNAAATITNAKRNGISASSLLRARRELGIASRKEGFGDAAQWVWDPPKKARPAHGRR